MDAKFFSSESFGFTGIRLSLMLAVGLGLAALVLDDLAGRFVQFGISLSLLVWLSAAVTALVGYWAVSWLQQLKAGQVIREDGPRAHLQKAGTPTMGGVFFVPAAVAIALVFSKFHPNVIAVSLLTLAYGAIGWVDDWQILRRHSNQGISPRTKLVLQAGFAALFCLWLFWSQPVNITTISLPFSIAIPLGILFWPFAAFVLMAESNAVNLTDGLDGLAGGTAAIAFLGLGALVAPTSTELMIFCACISGSCLGFLAYNRNPAKVFMGDTGSMALGGAIAGTAILSANIWGLFVLSGIFFVETLSVIAQVGYYKATKGPDGAGKRLFKMAPLHHHLELSGWSEIQVVAIFYSVGGMLALLAFIIGK